LVTKKCAIFDDCVTYKKWDFINPVQDGRNTPRKWENFAKSVKAGVSAVCNTNDGPQPLT